MRNVQRWPALATILLAVGCGQDKGNQQQPSGIASMGSGLSQHAAPGDESRQVIEAVQERYAARAAPLESPPAAAWPAAVSYVRGVASSSKTAWTEIGPKNYNSDNPLYADPYFSNTGGGAGINSGRITALVVTSAGNTVFAGGADGGLWKSTNGGATWTPVGDFLDSLSIGALAIDDQGPSGYTLYVGTGESNTNQDSYAGVGILKSTDGGATFSYVGGTELQGALISRIVVDPVDRSRLYAATSHGLYRWTAGATAWQRILGTGSSPVANLVSDVAVRPGTGGATGTVVAIIGWRNGASTNGVFVSYDGGDSFTGPINPQGYVPAQSQGRVSLAYASDGSKLYAVVQDPQLMTNPNANSVLAGVYVSNTGDPTGPYNQIASPSKLQGSTGSAMKVGAMGKDYQPGIQAWYNQSIAVDPMDPNHVYVGLEEVYETTNGGSGWTTLGAYWNLTLPCFSYNPLGGTCVPTTHSDQHAAFIAAGTLWVGNDGGVWSRPLNNHQPGGWNNLNATLGTLQFYFAAASQAPNGPMTYYGGLQDNGTAKVVVGQDPAEPFGGDGGDVLVDPNNPDHVMTEYTNLDVAKSLDGGKSWTDIHPPDPNARFIAPYLADPLNFNHLVAGGQYVWESTKGFDTLCDGTGCDWTPTFNQGSGRTTTTLGVAGSTIYAGWCGPCNPNMITGVGFNGGIASNYGGSWHQLTPPLTTRYVSGLTVDPANPAHVYAIYSGFSRHWVVGPYDAGVGHVYESQDGGNTWTDISGNLVDAPANGLLIVNGSKIAVATDLGVFSSGTHGGTWTRAGSGLPFVTVNDLRLGPGGIVLAATHGRGMWQIPASAL